MFFIKKDRAYNTLQKNYKSLREDYFKLLDEHVELSRKARKLEKKEQFINNTKFPNWFVKLFKVKN